MPDDQIVLFDQQAESIDKFRAGEIDAYASTALGKRILADRIRHEFVEAASQGPANIPGYSPRSTR
jgi:polar amino acid transport system substrate-binding protein